MDKCLGEVVVPNALKAAGCRVEIMTDHFEQDCADTEWLPEVGRRGWIILSKDKNLRHNHIEIVALLKSGAPAFLLTSGDLTGDAMAEAFVTALPHMQRMSQKFSPPFIAQVSRSGSVKLLYTFDGMIRKVVAGPRPKRPEKPK